MISIVIPVLNEEKLLSDCLRSLGNQDFTGEYEVVVVDNGSTDGSVRIAGGFGARVLFCPSQRDVVRARDYGARAAYGDIVVQADADTIYPRDWLTRIAKHISAHPEAVAVAGTFVYSGRPSLFARVELCSRQVINFFTVRVFGRPYIISGANFAFLKKAFSHVDGYDKKTYSADQYGISTRLSKAGKIIYDRKLSVATSPRRLEKPLLLLLMAAILNLYRLCEYVLKFYAGILQTAIMKPVKPPSLRTYAKLLPPVLAAAFLAYGYFIPTSQVFGKVYYEGKSPGKAVALTFDDGPNDPYTSQILDILALYGIKATFFTTGGNVELYPETARRIIAEGHVLGNHSYSHKANHALTEQGWRDTKLAQKSIFNVVGVRPHLYRPPHGKKSPWELQLLKEENLIEVTWSVSTSELRARSPESLAQEIVKRTELGDIILLHDGYGNSHNCSKADKTITVEALPIIIRTLQDRGYRFVTVSELLKVPAYN